MLVDSHISSAYKRQSELVDISDETGVAFSDVLTEAGLSYDDLIYQHSCEKLYTGRKAVTLDDIRLSPTKIPVVSFFTGCGGMDLGLEAAGFNHLACFEFNELFCKTLRRNRPEWKIFGPPVHSGDVSKFDEIVEALSGMITSPFEGIFVGGPPCQPFSIAANQRFSKSGENFKRVGFAHETNGNLFFDFVRLIVEYKPAVFMIENVPGLRDLDGGIQLKEAFKILSKEGYKCAEPFVLDAQHFNVPQQRHRLFVIGNRESNKHFSEVKPNLEPIGCGSVLLNNSLKGALNSETRIHTATSIRRYALLNYGQRDQLGRVDRLDPTLPSKTVIAGGINGGGRSHLHPEIPRTLSVRESARLQTFPDDYVFVGPTARQFTQVGNAVPPVLAAQLGAALMKSFF